MISNEEKLLESKNKFIKNHFVMNKKKFIIGCVCVGTALGGVSGYAIYKTIKGLNEEVTQNDLFLRALDRLGHGNYTSTIKTFAISYCEYDVTKGLFLPGYEIVEYSNNGNQDRDYSYYIDSSGSKVDEYLEYGLLNEKNEKISVFKNFNNKFYEEKDFNDYLLNLKENMVVFNDFTKYTFDSGTFIGNFQLKDLKFLASYLLGLINLISVKQK